MSKHHAVPCEMTAVLDAPPALNAASGDTRERRPQPLISTGYHDRKARPGARCGIAPQPSPDHLHGQGVGRNTNQTQEKGLGVTLKLRMQSR